MPPSSRRSQAWARRRRSWWACSTPSTHFAAAWCRLDLAYEAIEIERKVLNESVGCQDQTFAAVGGFNLIEFRSMGNFVVHRIPFTNSRLEEFEDHLLIFFTGIKRRAEELAARQVKRMGQNRQRLVEMRGLVDEG